jgi:hypothetical protein
MDTIIAYAEAFGLEDYVSDVINSILKEETMTFRQSTNPYYEGNTDGVKAHLRNTVKIEVGKVSLAPYIDPERFVDNIVAAVTQRWHLTHANDLENEVNDLAKLSEENQTLRTIVETFKQLDEINAHVDALNEVRDNILAQIDEYETASALLDEKGAAALDTLTELMDKIS